jgi:hypothetical protein
MGAEAGQGAIFDLAGLFSARGGDGHAALAGYALPMWWIFLAGCPTAPETPAAAESPEPTEVGAERSGESTNATAAAAGKGVGVDSAPPSPEVAPSPTAPAAASRSDPKSSPGIDGAKKKLLLEMLGTKGTVSTDPVDVLANESDRRALDEALRGVQSPPKDYEGAANVSLGTKDAPPAE